MIKQWRLDGRLVGRFWQSVLSKFFGCAGGAADRVRSLHAAPAMIRGSEKGDATHQPPENRHRGGAWLDGRRHGRQHAR